MKMVPTITGTLVIFVAGLLCLGILWPEVTRVEEPVAEFQPVPAKLKRIQVGLHPLLVEVAETEEQRSRGLSGREKLETDRGMLFVFGRPGYYSFWMKEMKFSLDMVWLNDDGTITDITREVKFDSYPQVFQPKGPAKYVLEVNAGWTKQNGINVGDYVNLEKIRDKGV